MKISFTKKNSGFTLVELMTAMAVTSILVVIIVSMTLVAMNFFKSSREDVIASRSSRPALLTLATDLESMHYRQGNNFEWLYAGKDANLNASTSLKLGPLERRAANAVRLIFFTSSPDRFSSVDSFGYELQTTARRSGGDVNCVSYRLVYQDHILGEDARGGQDSLGFPVFSLYRNVVPADATYSGGQGGGALLGRDNLLQAYSSRERDEATLNTFLAENIIEFTIAFEIEYVSRGGGSGKRASDKSIKLVPILATPSKGGIQDARDFRLRGNGLAITGGGATADMLAGRLSAIHVCMTVLTEEGMNRVDQIRSGIYKNRERDFFSKYTRNYTERIPINR